LAQGLCPGNLQSIRSCDGTKRLVLQTDHNLVLYDDQHANALWQTNTAKPAPIDPGANHLVMQSDGNLVLYGDPFSPNPAVYWSSNTSGSTRLQVQNDGRIVVYRVTDNSALGWSCTGNLYGVFGTSATCPGP
jgi:hypothetical protein